MTAENPPPKSDPGRLNDPTSIQNSTSIPPRPVHARGGIWSARKIRAAHGEREGGGRDGYAPGKRWSPSTVGRKRKYWDWLSPVHGTEVRLSVRERACPRRGSFPSPSLLFPTSSTSSSFLPRWGQDSPLDAPRTTLRYTFLSTYGRRFLAYRFLAGSRTPSDAMGNPLRQTTRGAHPSLSLSLGAITARSFFSLPSKGVRLSRFVTPSYDRLCFRYKSNLT